MEIFINDDKEAIYMTTARFSGKCRQNRQKKANLQTNSSAQGAETKNPCTTYQGGMVRRKNGYSERKHWPLVG